MEPIIKVDHLSRSFRQYKKEPGLIGSVKSLFVRDFFDIYAVTDISFSIKEGERVGFIGPNGAGKTTTLKMLSGLLYPSSGMVSVLGYEPFRRQNVFLKKYALVMGQKSQLWWDLPPMEGFLLNKEIYEIPDAGFKKTVDELAEILEVKELLKVPVRKLSLGQRMKCELMAALIHKPQILFLDEPTIGLDVVIQKKIRSFLKEYNEKYKTTIMLTSHYMDDVAEICDRVIVINHGVIVYDGLLTRLTYQFANEKILKITFNQVVKKEKLAKFGKVIEFEEDGLATVLSVKRADHAKIAGEILNQFEVDDLDIAEVRLEDIIRQIFEQKK